MNMTAAHPAAPDPAERTGPIAWFAGNRAAAKLLMLFLLAGGVLSGLHLAVQSLPDIETRRVTVTVRSPGSSAKEVEEDINRRVEEAVVGLAASRGSSAPQARAAAGSRSRSPNSPSPKTCSSTCRERWMRSRTSRRAARSGRR